MRPYIAERNGAVRFWRNRNGNGRIRSTRKRMQRCFASSVPIRVENYDNPTFYYSFLIHRRKRNMDLGVQKVKHGTWRANYIMNMEEVLS